MDLQCFHCFLDLIAGHHAVEILHQNNCLCVLFERKGGITVSASGKAPLYLKDKLALPCPNLHFLQKLRGVASDTIALCILIEKLQTTARERKDSACLINLVFVYFPSVNLNDSHYF